VSFIIRKMNMKCHCKLTSLPSISFRKDYINFFLDWTKFNVKNSKLLKLKNI